MAKRGRPKTKFRRSVSIDLALQDRCNEYLRRTGLNFTQMVEAGLAALLKAEGDVGALDPNELRFLVAHLNHNEQKTVRGAIVLERLLADGPSPLPDLALFHETVNLNRFAIDGDLYDTVDASGMMVWVAGPNNENLHSSRGLREYTGLTIAQLQNMSWADLLHPDDRERTLQIARAGFQSRKPFTHVYRFRRADGQYGWILDSSHPRYYPDGRFGGYVGTMREFPGLEWAGREFRKMVRHYLQDIVNPVDDLKKPETEVWPARVGDPQGRPP